MTNANKLAAAITKMLPLAVQIKTPAFGWIFHECTTLQKLLWAIKNIDFDQEWKVVDKLQKTTYGEGRHSWQAVTGGREIAHGTGNYAAWTWLAEKHGFKTPQEFMTVITARTPKKSRIGVFEGQESTELILMLSETDWLKFDNGKMIKRIERW